MPYSNVQYVDVTFTLDTSAYGSGDLIADTQVITNACPAAGVPAVLHSVHLIDEDDQKVAVDLVFFDANVSMGTENSAPSITDANGRSCLGVVSIAAGDYKDLGGVAIATKDSIGKVVKPATGTADIYVAIVSNASTPTYTASGLRGRFGFI
jgi:hypothetical protein